MSTVWLVVVVAVVLCVLKSNQIRWGGGLCPVETVETVETPRRQPGPP